MSVGNINWQQVCCAHHGDYAEHPAAAGGVLRIKRGPEIDGYLVCEFGADGRCIDADADGVPQYRQIDESGLLALIA